MELVVQETHAGSRERTALGPDRVEPLLKGLTGTASVVDRWLSRAWRGIFGEAKGIVILVFHAVLPAGPRTPDVDPAYAVTPEQLREVLDYFNGRGFQPIGPPHLRAPLDPARNYVMFTFDDGYANNVAAFEMLEAAGVPVLFSVNTANVRSGESFWWDVLYRELTARGASSAQIERERTRMIEMPPAAIRTELLARFGSDAFTARGEHDRPISAAELRALAGRPLISLGNHTMDHQLLEGGDEEQLVRSLMRAQRELEDLTGVAPRIIAYPYGRYDEMTIACCQALAFEAGLTGEFGKVRLAGLSSTSRRLQLPRCVIYGDRAIANQCENTHLDWKPSWMVRRILRQWRGGSLEARGVAG